MITKFNLHRLRAHESAQYFSDFNKIFEAYATESLKEEKHYHAFLQILKRLEIQRKPLERIKLTAEMVALDERRDRAILCMKNLLRGYSYHKKEEKVAAAARIIKQMDSYGKRIYDFNYKAETKVIEKLGADLNNGLLADIELLDLKEVLDEMLEANTLFNGTFHERIDKNAEYNDQRALGLVKLAIEEYNEVCRYIDANYLLHPEENIKTLISRVNSLVVEFEQMLAHRKHDKNEGEDEAA